MGLLPPNSIIFFLKYSSLSVAILATETLKIVSETPFILLPNTNSDALYPDISRLLQSTIAAPALKKIFLTAITHCGTITECLMNLPSSNIILCKTGNLLKWKIPRLHTQQ